MTRRPVSIDDLFELRLVDDPAVSPCGGKVAFTVTRLDREENEYRSQVWILDIADGTSTPLTSGLFRDVQPQWSPDGRAIAFLSKRSTDEDGESGAQIHLIPAAGGEATQISNYDRSISAFEWSPDGRRLLFIANKRLSEDHAGSDVRVITTARFRSDGVGYFDDAFKQVFVLERATGTMRQLTAGPYDHVQATWSPNGNEIAFVSNRRTGWEFSSVRDIYLAKVESGHIRQFTDGNGRWSLPSWSHDGSAIVALGTRDLKSASSRNEVFVARVAEGDMQSVTPNLDVDFRDSSISDWNGYGQDEPRWIGDDQILTVAGVRGSVVPAIVDLSSGDHRLLVGESGRFGHPQRLRDGRILATRSTAPDPGEVVVIDTEGSVEALTGFNRDWLAEVELSHPEPIEVQSPDGESVSGWIMKPAGLAEGAKAPLALEIHGGPFGMYADTFMHEFQLLAAQGYGVVYANPRGSAGYGDRFAGMLLPDMGFNDLPDLMAIVDRAVEEPWVDADRLGVLGGSYGGFMTNWVVAHTDRFNAAVTQRTISDWYSTWGTDDIFFADEDVTLGAPPWEDPELYFRISPLTYVDQMTTPMLIIHSEEDYRCPIPQGEQLFVSLKRLGRTTELVRFPDESHGLSRTGSPNHRVERLEHILRWFDTHL